jgi:hypothetical protein
MGQVVLKHHGRRGRDEDLSLGWELSFAQQLRLPRIENLIERDVVLAAESDRIKNRHEIEAR